MLRWKFRSAIVKKKVQGRSAKFYQCGHQKHHRRCTLDLHWNLKGALYENRNMDMLFPNTIVWKNHKATQQDDSEVMNICLRLGYDLQWKWRGWRYVARYILRGISTHTNCCIWYCTKEMMLNPVSNGYQRYLWLDFGLGTISYDTWNNPKWEM